MSLKKLFRILLGVQFLLGVGLAVLTALLYLNQEKLSQSQDIYFESYLLADELRQSSDDLTRLVRTYVATGDEKYEREYWAVLDIRNGKIPRPVAYNRIYWDFISGTGQKPRPDGVAISLRELMTKEGFTDAELQKLALSQKYSDELVKTEMIAMNAVRGLFDDGTGKFTIKKKPDRALAIRLMNDEAYHKHKVNIMKPIDEFYTMFAERTAGDVTKYEQRSMNLLLSLGLLIIVIVTMFGYSFVILMRQIKEREQAEEALRESERKYRNIFDHAIEGIFQTTPEGRYSNVNPAFASMAGYGSPDEMQSEITNIGEQLYVNPEDRKRLLMLLQASAGTVREFETQVRRKDGTLFWVSINVRTVNDEVEKTTWLEGTCIDITERNRVEEEKSNLEERLQQAEKMEMMGKLAGRVAHDLNNVLGVLSGYSELLTERIPAGNPLGEYATNIFKSSGRAAAIVEDLLTLTRRGVRVMEIAKFNKIIADLLATPEFDKLVAYHPNVIVKTDLAKDLLNISGSPVHIEKTVMNLVSNAVEAIAGDGEVIIKTENRYLDKAITGYQTVKEGEYVVLTVSDTGKGIPASEVKNIFEPFYTRKSMGRSGTGLGLAIVWGAVQDHNGYIDVQSIEGKGTTFTLYFPATRKKAEEEAQKIPIEQYMGHGESVLVVDDMPEQREVATTLLSQLGYTVNAVSSGEDAVEYLKCNKADILEPLDMIMEPGIDGLDTYKLVLEINPKQRAIIVSGFSETDRSKEAEKLGAGAYVKKPYVLEKIGLAIWNELARK